MMHELQRGSRTYYNLNSIVKILKCMQYRDHSKSSGASTYYTTTPFTNG